MKRAQIVYTRHIDGTTYESSAWWALNHEGHAIAGPSNSKAGIARELAGINRRVRIGEYAPRELYTTY